MKIINVNTEIKLANHTEIGKSIPQDQLEKLRKLLQDKCEDIVWGPELKFDASVL